MDNYSLNLNILSNVSRKNDNHSDKISKNEKDISKKQIEDERDLLGSKNAVKEAWLPQSKIITPKKEIILPSKKIILPEKQFDVVDTSTMTKVKKNGLANKISLSENIKNIFPNCEVEYFNSKDKTESVAKISKEEWTDNGICNFKEETTISSKNPTLATKKINDYEHNSTTVLEIENPLDFQKIHYKKQITEYRDKNGIPERQVTYEASDLKGVYNVTQKDLKTGEVKKLCDVNKNADGSYSIKKDLVSLDGTRTQSVLEKDATGKHSKLTKKITDKDGNLVLDFSRTYDRESDKLAYSSVNNRKYKIENGKNEVTVTDMATNEARTMKVEDFMHSSFEEDDREYKWSELLGVEGKSQKNHIDYLFKNLPGDTLFNMNKELSYIVKTNNDLESYFSDFGPAAMLNCGTELMVINHELGHSHDSVYNPDGDPMNDDWQYGQVEQKDEEFKQMYLAERGAFIKQFPDFEEQYIDYFINSPFEKPTRGEAETIAETNAINGLAPEIPERIAMRTIYLEQYFPKSIAVASKRSTSIHIPNEVY